MEDKQHSRLSVCLNCGRENPVDAKFCSICGWPLLADNNNTHEELDLDNALPPLPPQTLVDSSLETQPINIEHLSVIRPHRDSNEEGLRTQETTIYTDDSNAEDPFVSHSPFDSFVAEKTEETIRVQPAPQHYSLNANDQEETITAFPQVQKIVSDESNHESQEVKNDSISFDSMLLPQFTTDHSASTSPVDMKQETNPVKSHDPLQEPMHNTDSSVLEAMQNPVQEPPIVNSSSATLKDSDTSASSSVEASSIESVLTPPSEHVSSSFSDSFSTLLNHHFDLSPDLTIPDVLSINTFPTVDSHSEDTSVHETAPVVSQKPDNSSAPEAKTSVSLSDTPVTTHKKMTEESVLASHVDTDKVASDKSADNTVGESTEIISYPQKSFTNDDTAAEQTEIIRPLSLDDVETNIQQAVTIAQASHHNHTNDVSSSQGTSSSVSFADSNTAPEDTTSSSPSSAYENTPNVALPAKETAVLPPQPAVRHSHHSARKASSQKTRNPHLQAAHDFFHSPDTTARSTRNGQKTALAGSITDSAKNFFSAPDTVNAAKEIAAKRTPHEKRRNAIILIVTILIVIVASLFFAKAQAHKSHQQYQATVAASTSQAFTLNPNSTLNESLVSENQTTYANKDYGFSFAIPQSFTQVSPTIAHATNTAINADGSNGVLYAAPDKAMQVEAWSQLNTTNQTAATLCSQEQPSAQQSKSYVYQQGIQCVVSYKKDGFIYYNDAYINPGTNGREYFLNIKYLASSNNVGGKLIDTIVGSYQPGPAQN